MIRAKSILTSKTIWVNLVAVGASYIAAQCGIVIDADTQVAVLGVINWALRTITHQPVEWSLPKPKREV